MVEQRNNRCKSWLHIDARRIVNNGTCAYAWFVSVKTAQKLAFQGVECVMQIKQYQSLYPELIEKVERYSGGVQ
jgi:hypothetical protein